jgi:chromate transporter
LIFQYRKKLANLLAQFYGFRSVGVILNLALTFGAAVIFPNLQIDFFALVLAISAFVALYFFKVDVLLVVIVGGFCGLVKYFLY